MAKIKSLEMEKANKAAAIAGMNMYKKVPRLGRFWGMAFLGPSILANFGQSKIEVVLKQTKPLVEPSFSALRAEINKDTNVGPRSCGTTCRFC